MALERDTCLYSSVVSRPVPALLTLGYISFGLHFHAFLCKHLASYTVCFRVVRASAQGWELLVTVSAAAALSAADGTKEK